MKNQHHYVSVFDMDEADIRCDICDCRPGGRWSWLSCDLHDEITAIRAINPEDAVIVSKHRNEFVAGANDARWGQPSAVQTDAHGLSFDSDDTDTPSVVAYRYGYEHGRQHSGQNA